MKKKKVIKKIKHDCSLLPFEREEILSIQDAMQRKSWAIDMFDLPTTWTHTQGNGVKIAILDTGVDLNHPDLIDNILPGKNFINQNLNPNDDNGHGSHVAGIICAENNDLGVVGVAPLVKIIPVKVLNKQGNGNLINVAEGIRWAANQDADFIVMSLGSPNKMQIISDAIAFAESRGVVVFCAAGNAGKTKQIFYPAAYSNVIGVGAMNDKYKRANFSCTGSDLDFLGPGVDILSTVPDDWYAVLSGTSMACPFVAGLAALFLSYVRAHNIEIPLNNSNDYVNLLKQYVSHVDDPSMVNKKQYEGWGILDARLMNNFFTN